METISDPLKEYPELVSYLMLAHMSSFMVNGHLTSLLGHLTVVDKGAVGPLNEIQQEQLDLALHAAKRLQEHLNVFITASRLLFTPQRYYLVDDDLLSLLQDFVKKLETDKFQVVSELPAEYPSFKADYDLVHYAIRSIGRLMGQIHPTSQGEIHLSLKFENGFTKLILSTNKEEEIYPLGQNPDLFIVQAVAKLHAGEFIVENNGEHCILTLSLSTTRFS